MKMRMLARWTRSYSLMAAAALLSLGLPGTACDDKGGDTGGAAPATQRDHSREAEAALRYIYDSLVAYYQAEHLIDPRLASTFMVSVRSSDAGDTYQDVTITGADYDGATLVETLRLAGTATVPGTQRFATVTAIVTSALTRGEVTIGSSTDDEVGSLDAGFDATPAPGPVSVRASYGVDPGDAATIVGLDDAGQPAREDLALQTDAATTSRKSFSAILDVQVRGSTEVDVLDSAGQRLFSVSGGESALAEALSSSYLSLPWRPYGADEDTYEDQWLPGSAPLTPATMPCGEPVRTSAQDWQHPTWRALTFVLDGPQYYSYRFESSGQGDGSTFTITAVGDTDCDGVVATFRRYGTGIVISGGYSAEVGFRGELESENRTE